MDFKNELRIAFSGKSHLRNLIGINVLIFLVFAMVKLIGFLSGSNAPVILSEWVGLSSDMGKLAYRPWTFITYMFVHFDFFHVLFNLLVLYWTGRIFSDFLPQSKLTTTYVIGGLAGGLAFVLMYNTIPVFAAQKEFALLVGASAGVLSVMAAAAVLAPNYPVHLLLFGEVRLKYIAVLLTILYLFSIPDSNSGGNIAHLGGVLAGFTYIKFFQRGWDVGKWIEFAFTYRNKPGKFKVVHTKVQSKVNISTKKPNDNQEVIDSILDKISRSGYQSLTKSEKEALFKASGEPLDNDKTP